MLDNYFLSSLLFFAAYGFSRYKFPGRSPLLYSILFTRVFAESPLFWFPSMLHYPIYSWLIKISGLVLVYLIVGMPITVWLLKGYIDALPAEVEEAALVDGCRPLQILFRIVVPMVAPAIAAIGMYSFYTRME
ncbi:MAG: ABC transporter permease subunit [Saccharofermentanales bacterium]